MLAPPPLHRLKSALAASDPVALLRDLVRTPSHPGIPRREEAVVGILVRYLEGHGLRVTTADVVAGRPNLLATVEGCAGGRHILLCGHTDTVAPNASASGDPFAAEIRDGRLWGRGSVDMKGGLAAMAAALVLLHKVVPLPRGRATLAAVIDEEMESLGAEALIRSGFQADGAVVGEPTGNRVALGHKGLEWIEIEFSGKAAHGGAAESGINAISGAAFFMRLMEEELIPQLIQRNHPLLGPPTINLGTISGGDQPSTVAARCVLRLDRRLVPGETAGGVFAELEALLARVRQRQPGLSTDLRRMPGGMATMVHGPLDTPLDHPVAQAAGAARARLHREPGSPMAFQAWTDAALLSREAGIASVVLGPGDLRLAHAPDESVPIREVEEAALVYALTALDFCAGSETAIVPLHAG